MKKMIWSNELSIGNADIDNDHKKLLEIIDDLIDLDCENGNRKKFAEVLSKLTDYVLIHLKREEKYMERLGYPKMEEHIKAHREYNYRVTMYNIRLLESNPPEPKEIVDYLEKWWVNHIMTEDLGYENYKRSSKSEARYPSI